MELLVQSIGDQNLNNRWSLIYQTNRNKCDIHTFDQLLISNAKKYVLTFALRGEDLLEEVPLFTPTELQAASKRAELVKRKHTITLREIHIHLVQSVYINPYMDLCSHVPWQALSIKENSAASSGCSSCKCSQCREQEVVCHWQSLYN